MKLYFIAAVSQDDSEYNLDLFVWADSHTDAIKDWRQHYYIADPSVMPDKVFIVPCDRPDGQQAGVLQWGTDVAEVRVDPVE